MTMRGLLSLGAYQGGAYSITDANIQATLAATHTTAVKIWASWLQHQPTQPPAGTTPLDQFAAMAATPAAATLDGEIMKAKELGLMVVLTSHMFPDWSNATRDPTDTGAYQKTNFKPADRFNGSSAWTDYVITGPPAVGDPKPLYSRFPASTGYGTGSPYGVWMGYLNWRYGALQTEPKLHVDFLEPLNEPNWSLWPQQADSASTSVWDNGANTSACATAQMLQTAQSMQHFFQGPVMLGPATLDTEIGTTRHHTNQTEFENLVLTALQSNGFVPDARVGWSVHNYSDWKNGTNAHLSACRTRVHGFASPAYWKGYPSGAAANAQIFITEGGRPRKQALAYDADEDTQQSLYMYYAAYFASSVPDIATFCQYLDLTDPNYDSGLRTVGGVRRNAWYMWRDLHGGTPGVPTLLT